MVRAERADLKTQTRRALKLSGGRDPSKNTPGVHAPIEPYHHEGSWNLVLSATGHGLGDPFPCPYGVSGDRLWVREAWRTGAALDSVPPRDVHMRSKAPIHYEADGPAPDGFGRYRHARFMCRWMSRTLLEITQVRVERLQDISEADARAEGIERQKVPPCAGQRFRWLVPGAPHAGDSAREAYELLWESINGPGSWALNSWVWAITFKRIEVS